MCHPALGRHQDEGSWDRRLQLAMRCPDPMASPTPTVEGERHAYHLTPPPAEPVLRGGVTAPGSAGTRTKQQGAHVMVWLPGCSAPRSWTLSPHQEPVVGLCIYFRKNFAQRIPS